MKRGLQIFQRKAGQDENAKPNSDSRRRTLSLSGSTPTTGKPKNDRQSRPSGLLRRSLQRASNDSEGSGNGGKDAGVPQRRRTLLGKQRGPGMAASLSMPDAIGSLSDAGGPTLELSSNAARDALLSIGERGEIVDATTTATHSTQTPPADAIHSSSSSTPHSAIACTPKQVNELQSAIRDLRSDNEAIREEIAQLKLDHSSSVSALCSEIARLRAAMLSFKALSCTQSGLPRTSSGSRFRLSVPPFTASALTAPSTVPTQTSSGLPIRSSTSSSPATVTLSSTLRQPPSQASQKFLRAQATLLAAERAEALLASLSEEARQAVRTESRREVRTSGQAKARLSALFSASGSTSKLVEHTEHTHPLSLSRNEAVDALAASHAILELQQLCDLHGNSNHGSFDSLLSEDSRGSGSAEVRGSDSDDLRALDTADLRASTPTSADSVSVYSAGGSSPQKLSVSPFATLTATPMSRSDVSLRTEESLPVELPHAPSGFHPALLVENYSPSGTISALASTEDPPLANYSETTEVITSKPPSPIILSPHQRLVSSNSKSRIPIPLGWRRLNSSSPPSPPLSLTTLSPKLKSPSPDGLAGCNNTESMLASRSLGVAPGKGSRMSEDQRGSPM
ncbi:hypothetical protein EV121DRAFT_287097 [Schizophyllum commune]